MDRQPSGAGPAVRRRTARPDCGGGQGREEGDACPDVGAVLRVQGGAAVPVLRVLTALALMVPGACSDLRVKEGIYTSLEDAKTAGAIQAGWVPSGLPAGAA